MGVQLDAYRKHMSGTKPLSFTPTIELDIVLDVLNGCEMKCPGCFVERKNSFIPNDLQRIFHLTQQFKDAGIEANELFLGPTDIFATSNFHEVISQPLFDKLVDQYAAITFTSTMLTPHEELSEKVDQLMSIMAPYGKRFELFVVLDIPKYIRNDRSYLDLLDKNLELIAKIDPRLKKQVNVFFITNFYPEMFSEIEIYDLNQKLKQDYNTKFKINPSFARASNSKMIEKSSILLKDILEKQIGPSRLKDVYLNMADIYFGGETFHPLTYVKGKLYLAPFLYEFIPLQYPELEVKCRDDGFFYMEDIFSRREELTVKQYSHAETLDSCKSCEFLPSCVARNHIQFMKLHDIKKCVVPKNLFRSSYKILENEL